jgi:hypothetical protein
LPVRSVLSKGMPDYKVITSHKIHTMRKQTGLKSLLTIITCLFLLLTACQPSPPPTEYSVPELKYKVLANFSDFFWCDPDYYPIAREGQEQLNAIEQFPTIKSDAAEFQAILKHLNMPDISQHDDAEKLQIYREHKKLTRVMEFSTSGTINSFVIRVGENQGQRIEGTILINGTIKITKRETSFNTCPICLAEGTLINTPDGPVPVERIHEGMAIWTVDCCGGRSVATVVRTASSQVPSSFEIVRITLSDGRHVTASPLHPTADGRVLGQYTIGDILDGSTVTAVKYLPYDGITYDLLPSGVTGLYWANGILLKSTLYGDGR